MKESIILVIALAVVLDFIIGDPHGWWHPVIGIGKLITFLEKPIRKVCAKSKTGQILGGIILWVLVVLLTGGSSFLLILIGNWIHPLFGMAVKVIMGYQVLAAKSLKVESIKVYNALQTGTIEDARFAVSMIVGRDTQQLEEEGVIKATVETIAENTADGVIAPLFYLALFGPIVAMVYKAMNTMDSMIGYKNSQYQNFGFFAAKMDDVVNYIPARIAAWGMLLFSKIVGYSPLQGWKIWKRDRRNHASPNSAQTEATMAGLLGIQLGGNATYFGVEYEKQTIGDEHRKIQREDIKKANQILYITTLGFAMLFIILRVGLYFIFIC